MGRRALRGARRLRICAILRLFSLPPQTLLMSMITNSAVLLCKRYKQPLWHLRQRHLEQQCSLCLQGKPSLACAICSYALIAYYCAPVIIFAFIYVFCHSIAMSAHKKKHRHNTFPCTLQATSCGRVPSLFATFTTASWAFDRPRTRCAHYSTAHRCCIHAHPFGHSGDHTLSHASWLVLDSAPPFSNLPRCYSVPVTQPFPRDAFQLSTPLHTPHPTPRMTFII